VSSTAPTWRDASLLLVALSGLYLVLVALISYGVGGYVAGRMRVRLSGGTPDEIEFRDGVHGAAAWALDTLRRSGATTAGTLKQQLVETTPSAGWLLAAGMRPPASACASESGRNTATFRSNPAPAPPEPRSPQAGAFS
jgi:hypothetical protein